MDSEAYDRGYEIGIVGGEMKVPKSFQKSHLKFDSFDRGWRDGKREHSKNTRCICTRVCDCQSPDTNPAGCSNECPEHNSRPRPNEECEAVKHWFEE